jgi:hypothetical protein
MSLERSDDSATGLRSPDPDQRKVGEAILRRKPAKTSRDRLVAEAVTAHGYSQMEVGSFLGLHYSTISRILAARQKSKSKDLTPELHTVCPVAGRF